MTQSLFGRLRRVWLNIHLWIGVGLFIVLVPLGLSGAALVWRDGLDTVLHPQRFAVSKGDTTLAASAYLDAARKAYGERAAVTQLRLPEEAGQPVIASGRVTGPPPGPGQRPRTLTAWIDPATARVLDIADTRDETIGLLHRLHGSLLVTTPGLGRKIVGWLGWAMSVSCLTGLWLWWPRNGKFRRGLRWLRSPSTFNNLHHMVGFWVLVPLLLVSLTGVYISFPETSRRLFGVETAPGPRGGQRPPAAAPLAEPGLPIDMAVAAAMAEKPGARLSAITLPTEGRKPVWRVQFAGEGHRLPATVQISDRDGAVLKGKGRPDQPDGLSLRMRRIHDAQDAPWIWQILVFATGVAPALLGVTGTVMWLRRRSRRAHLRRLARQPAG